MVIKKTKSLCPECLRPVDAEVLEEEGRVLIRKECPEHGDFENVYWSNSKIYRKAEEYDEEGEGLLNPQTDPLKGCPLDCGLCPEHKSHTVLGLIDVTNRCNLKCPICFANAAVSNYLYEPEYEEIREMLRNLRRNRPVPTPAIQYAGGEPTVRKDIVDLVKLAREEGFTHVQIATNGVRLARKPELAAELREAGLNTVYLQFDGVTEEPYIVSRGKNLLPLKLQAIENCRKAGLGIVLVPSLVRGLNDDQVGDIIRFAVDNIDIIRVLTSSQCPLQEEHPPTGWRSEDNNTRLPETCRAQTGSEIAVDDFYPASSVRPISDFVAAIEENPRLHSHATSTVEQRPTYS